MCGGGLFPGDDRPLLEEPSDSEEDSTLPEALSPPTQNCASAGLGKGGREGRLPGGSTLWYGGEG